MSRKANFDVKVTFQSKDKQNDLTIFYKVNNNILKRLCETELLKGKEQ